VGAGGAPEGLKAAMEIGHGLDRRARTGGRQREAQANGWENTLASTQRPVGATGIEQGVGKHPWALVRDHPKVAVLHRGLLALCPYQHAQEEFLMERYKNPQ